MRCPKCGKSGTKIYSCDFCGFQFYKNRFYYSQIKHEEAEPEKEIIIKTMVETGKPVSAGGVATISGIDRKEVDKCF